MHHFLALKSQHLPFLPLKPCSHRLVQDKFNSNSSWSSMQSKKAYKRNLVVCEFIIVKMFCTWPGTLAIYTTHIFIMHKVDGNIILQKCENFWHLILLKQQFKIFATQYK